MRRLTIHFGLVALLLGFAASLQAAELGKIDRSIGKQPQYTAKPAYCLLVFGPEAQNRAWLVLSGNDLYVDRNGNGDLTEAGKQITGNRVSDGEQTFSIGDVVASPDGRKHAQLSVEKFGEALYITAKIDGREQSAGNDCNGRLKLTDTPCRGSRHSLWRPADPTARLRHVAKGPDYAVVRHGRHAGPGRRNFRVAQLRYDP